MGLGGHPHRTPSRPCAGTSAFTMCPSATREDRPILHKVSLYAKPGQKIAFVGSTGAGKTTITNLINRFYDVQRRRHHLRRHRRAGHPKGRPAPLPGHCAPGHPPLHRHHCRQHPLRQAGRHQTRRWSAAARMANADSFIRRLPHGYDTMVTGDGRQPLPGPAAAAGHRPGRRGRPAGADPGRGHQLHRHPDRGPHRKGHGPADGGPDGVCHRPPPLHRPQRQRHHGAGSRPASSSGATTRTLLRPEGRCTTSSTTACSSSPDSPGPKRRLGAVPAHPSTVPVHPGAVSAPSWCRLSDAHAGHSKKCTAAALPGSPHTAQRESPPGTAPPAPF